MPHCLLRNTISIRPVNFSTSRAGWEVEPVAPKAKFYYVDSLDTHVPESHARTYVLPLNQLFMSARNEYPGISINPDVMGGAPCIDGTRIPVYMVLDAIEYYASLDVTPSYPRLSLQQVKDAIGFAKLIVECPIDDRLTSLA
jgi:uncharacterized protein (DUF433 family)